MSGQAIDGNLARDGFEIVRGFIDYRAVEAGRRIVDRIRAATRTAIAVDAQRIQPVTRYLTQGGLSELRDVAAFDRIHQELERMIGPGAEIDMSLLGLWIEPARRTYVLPWHRDIRDNAKGVDWRSWYGNLHSVRYYNQFHVAFRDDESLWIVPGSHRRDDTETEMRMFPTRPILVDFVERDLDPWYDGPDKFPPRSLMDRGLSIFDRIYYRGLGLPPRAAAAQRNAAILEKSMAYCHRMPGAQHIALKAGDFLVYRGSAWHTAIYRADVPRATLFSNASTPESLAWVRTHRPMSKAKGEAARWFSRDQLGA